MMPGQLLFSSAPNQLLPANQTTPGIEAARPAALTPPGEDVAGDWWRSEAGEKITKATCRLS
jgi:hypothetical protein